MNIRGKRFWVWLARLGGFGLGLLVLGLSLRSWNYEVVAADMEMRELRTNIDLSQELLKKIENREDRWGFVPGGGVWDQLWVWLAKDEEEKQRRLLQVGYDRIWQSIQEYESGEGESATYTLCKAKGYFVQAKLMQLDDGNLESVRETTISAQQIWNQVSEEMTVRCE